MGIKHWFFLLAVLVSCNTSTQYQAICEEAASLTQAERQTQLVGRRLIWHATVSDVVKSSLGGYLVLINDDHLEVKNVPEQIATSLHKGDPFNFIGTVSRISEDCFGEIEFNELNPSSP